MNHSRLIIIQPQHLNLIFIYNKHNKSYKFIKTDMEQIIKDERRSFQQKMDKINHSNQLLSNLEKKMQQHFIKRPISHPYPQQQLNNNKDHQDSDPHLLTSNLTDYQNQFIRQSQPQIQKNSTFNSKYNIFNELQIQKSGVIRSNHKEYPMSNEPLTKNQEKQLPQKPYRQLKDGTFRLFMKKKKNLELQEQNSEHPFNVMPQDQLKQKENKIKESNLQQFSYKYNNQSLEGQKHFEMVQQILKKKISMKEQAIIHLEKQLKIQNEERVHLYRINVQLEEELQNLQLRNQQEQDKSIKKLEIVLSGLTQELSNRNRQNKNLLKKQQLLKEQQKSLLKYRKQYIKNDQVSEEGNIKKNSKSTIERDQKIYSINKEQKVYNMVVNELDRLKIKVQKMKNVPKYRHKTSTKN